MALYTCIFQEGTLSPEQRATLAREITDAHVRLSGEPGSLIRVIFETFSPDSTFSDGKPAPNAAVFGLIGQGRSTEAKARLLKELWAAYKKVVGVGDDQLSVYVTEIPRSNGMEFGAILPDLGHEVEWLAQLGLANKYA